MRNELITRNKNSIYLPGVLVLKKAATSKLSDVELREVEGQRLRRPVPRAPFVCATYVSINATCPDTCTFKGKGCFAQSGYIKRFAGRLEEQAAEMKLTGLQIAESEAELLRRLWRGKQIPQDGARGGRDLRLHVGGDVSGEDAAKVLAAAAENWKSRDGGAVWTYTHRWREIPVEAWGSIAVWASTEGREQADEARALGYRVSVTMPDRLFTGNRKQPIGGMQVVPCPWESAGVSCVQCRLCLGESKLPKDTTIGFKIHGTNHERENAESAWLYRLTSSRRQDVEAEAVTDLLRSG